MFMGFFNSLSIRIPLAIIGGILYSLLTYYIVILLGLPSPLGILAAIFVFLFYLVSRLLILFSGIDSPYYSKGKKTIQGQHTETNSFYQTTQWVGKFYHYHDIVLFAFLVAISIAFLVSLIVDLAGAEPAGNTFQNLNGGDFQASQSLYLSSYRCAHTYHLYPLPFPLASRSLRASLIFIHKDKFLLYIEFFNIIKKMDDDFNSLTNKGWIKSGDLIVDLSSFGNGFQEEEKRYRRDIWDYIQYREGLLKWPSNKEEARKNG